MSQSDNRTFHFIPPENRHLAPPATDYDDDQSWAVFETYDHAIPTSCQDQCGQIEGPIADDEILREVTAVMELAEVWVDDTHAIVWTTPPRSMRMCRVEDLLHDMGPCVDPTLLQSAMDAASADET